MGLDMYLSKKTYVKNWDHQSDEEKHNITVLKGGKPRQDIKPERISYIEEEVAYWRKFNALHAWFVENCGGGEDNCQVMYVDEEKIKEILGILKEVKEILDNSKKIKKVVTGFGGNEMEIDVYEDEEKIMELLPTQSGFFFGGTEIDEYYKDDVINSIEVFEVLLDELEENIRNGIPTGDFYYQASW